MKGTGCVNSMSKGYVSSDRSINHIKLRKKRIFNRILPLAKQLLEQLTQMYPYAGAQKGIIPRDTRSICW